jgi:hypothetical protein
MFFWLPDTPANAKFLTPSQRMQAVERVKITNQTVLKSNVFRMDHFYEATTDIKVLLVVLFLVAVTICNSSLTAFSQIVLVGLGFDVRVIKHARAVLLCHPLQSGLTIPLYRCTKRIFSQSLLAEYMDCLVSPQVTYARDFATSVPLPAWYSVLSGEYVP